MSQATSQSTALPEPERGGPDGRLPWLSAHHAELTSEQAGHTIEDALGTLCRELGLEAAMVWQWKVGTPGTVTLTHVHNPGGLPLPADPVDAWELLPWTTQQVLTGAACPIPAVDRLPDAAARDRETWRRYGARTCLALPLSSWGKPLVGMLCLLGGRDEREWPGAIVTAAAAAQLVTDALTRGAAPGELGDSETRLASAVDIAELGFYETGRESRVTFLDWRTRRLLGVPAGEEHLAREYWLERLHPEDREAVLDASRQLREGERDVYAGQYRYRHPERGLVWLHHLTRVVARDAAGRQTRAIGVIHDVTSVKHTELALRDIAERYDSIRSTTTDGFLELDGRGRVLAANDAAGRMYGLASAELVGRSLSEFEAPHPQAPPLDFASLHSRRQTRIEARHRRLDGHPLDVEISATYREGTDTFLTFVRDVTARKRNARRLRESLNFNRTILASMMDEIAIVARDGEILAVNDAWERFARGSGGPDAGIATGVGANYLEVCRRANAHEALEGIDAVLGGRARHYRTEYAYPSHEGSRWFLMEVVPLRRLEGGAIVMHRDITERRRNDTELERLRTDVWHAHRVSQTGAISASLAHELNQPLAAILSNAQAGLRLLERPGTDLDEIRAILQDIVLDDKRAAGVIMGLRAMLRRKETQREIVDLGRTVQEVMTLARGELLAHEVHADLATIEECRVKVDRAQILQVILNLVTNAVEACYEQPQERRHVGVSLTRTAERRALLALSDRGHGIPEDEKDRVFESFWSTKPQGMGIGLPICRSITELHQGHLWFEANPDGIGTTFFLSLPIVDEPA